MLPVYALFCLMQSDVMFPTAINLTRYTGYTLYKNCMVVLNMEIFRIIHFYTKPGSQAVSLPLHLRQLHVKESLLYLSTRPKDAPARRKA